MGVGELALRTALVLGGAGCVWDDLEAALDLGEFQGVVACNDAGAAYPGEIDAFVSLHAEKAPLWMERRVRAGHPWPKAVLGHEGVTVRGGLPACITGTTPFRLPGQQDTGSSGLFALKVALIDLGFDRAVLCGVPMTIDQGHFFDPAAWRAAVSYRRGWEQALPAIKHRARSMSGWTLERLGAPDAEWLSA